MSVGAVCVCVCVRACVCVCVCVCVFVCVCVCVYVSSVYFLRSPGQAPYGAKPKPACAKRAAYPGPPSVVPDQESFAAQAAVHGGEDCVSRRTSLSTAEGSRHPLESRGAPIDIQAQGALEHCSKFDTSD